VDLNLSPGKTVKDLVIKLVPQAAFTGRVLDEAGDPVPQASVRVLAVQYRRGRRELVPLGMASSDDTGRYRVENVRPGKHYLFACAPGSGLGNMYYPGVRELSQASRVGAAPNSELGGLDFRLRKETGVRVWGAAVDENGQPLRNSFVTIAPREMLSHEGYPGAMVRGDGAFELRNVPPGLHTLRVRGFSSDQAAVEKQLNVADRDEEGVVMVAVPANGLGGAVSIAGNAAKLPANGRILMARADGFAAAPLTAAVEKDGTFALPRVLPTQYRVSTSGFGPGAYIAAVKAADREIAGREVDFAGGVPDRVEVVIAMDGAGLGGTVQHRDLPFADATVVLVPEESLRDRGSLYRVVRSDNNGSFTMTGIPPGTYKLFAWEEIEPGVWQDREFLRPFEDRGVKVVLQPKAAESVRLSLIPAAE
jgi:protocatechuate 3,4-dioxygenase beta subunit